MLRDEIARYTELSGNDGEHTPIGIIGAFLDGYETGLKDSHKGEWIPVGWIPNGRCGYPSPEEEYKHFLTIDNKGEMTVQEFLLSLDEEPVPYFTGMRNIVAWQPLPEPYTAEKGGE